MPEAGEVTVAARQLHAIAVGRAIEGIDVTHERTVRHTNTATVHGFVGTRIRAVEPVGKWILIRVDARPEVLGIHLRMSGQLLAAWPGDVAPDRHVHATFLLGPRTEAMPIVDDVPGPPIGSAGEPASPVQVWFRDPRTFGELRPMSSAPGAPDIRNPIVTPAFLHERARARRAPVKAVLLDQARFVAGVGSYLADEVLHDAGIDPRRPAQTLARTAWARVLDAARVHIAAAAAVGGVTLADEGWIDLWGRPGRYGDAVRVHARAACGTCGAPTKRTIVSGRSARWCPTCQHPRRVR